MLLRLLAVAALLLAPSSALTTNNDIIVSASGQPIQLKGANWFGFNNGMTMVDGLWDASNGMSYDFATIVYRWQLLGFNSVRLPFSFKDLYSLTPRSFYSSTCSLPTLTQVVGSTVPPGFTLNPNVVPPGPITSPNRSPPGCNGYLPTGSTLDRFVWVVQYLSRNGFYVLVDNHLREDQTALENKALWLERWTDVVTKISEDPVARERLMVDILNEPDNYGVRWPTLKDLYLDAMDALYPVNPEALFFVEGTAQGGLWANWGDGFATDAPSLQIVGSDGDPNPFFQTLMGKPYLNQVVLSPHVYGPSVSTATAYFDSAGLVNRLTRSFGSLTSSGYTYNGVTKRFPVAIGEFGSKFEDSRDLSFLSDFQAYLNNEGVGADGLHNAIPNWFYWCWNANSGDTGGLVDFSWINLEWNKFEYLQQLGLQSWYLGTPSPSPPPNPPPSPLPPPPPPPPPLPPSPGPPIGGAVTCALKVGISTPWRSGGDSAYSSAINFFVSQTGGDEVIPVPWTLRLQNPTYSGMYSAWNMHMDGGVPEEGFVKIVAPLDWQALRPQSGNLVNVGGIVNGNSSSAKDYLPLAAELNGKLCSVESN